jgi:D-methionine transport system permease protein
MLETILKVFDMVLVPAYQTIMMVSWTTIFGLMLGLPVGVLLNITSPNGLSPKPKFNAVVSVIINLFRSFPFLILMILVFPLARIIVGESTGTKATIVPLAIATAPFIARIIENSLQEIDPQVIQAAKVMGSTNWQIIYKVMLPEAKPSIIAGLTLTIIAVIGNSAMAGAIGGGGLGDLAIRYGYHRYKIDVMIGAVLVIILLVAIVQFTGTKIVKRIIAKR